MELLRRHARSIVRAALGQKETLRTIDQAAFSSLLLSGADILVCGAARGPTSDRRASLIATDAKAPLSLAIHRRPSHRTWSPDGNHALPFPSNDHAGDARYIDPSQYTFTRM